MQRFKDSMDTEWDISFTIGVLEKIKDHPDLRGDDDKPLDLANAYQNNALPILDTDVVLLVRTLYVICEPQCEKKGISPEQFGERLVGDAIDNARNAVVAALLDFFPSQKRALLAKIVEKQDMLMGEAVSAMEKYWGNDRLKTAIATALDDAVREAEESMTSGETSTT